MNPKVISIVAHIGPIGWIIAFLINQNNRSFFSDFYLRQTLGMVLAGVVCPFIPVVGWLCAIALFVFWIMSLVNCVQDNTNELPFIGKYFQDWFRGL